MVAQFPSLQHAVSQASFELQPQPIGRAELRSHSALQMLASEHVPLEIPGLASKSQHPLSQSPTLLQAQPFGRSIGRSQGSLQLPPDSHRPRTQHSSSHCVEESHGQFKGRFRFLRHSFSHAPLLEHMPSIQQPEEQLFSPPTPPHEQPSGLSEVPNIYRMLRTFDLLGRAQALLPAGLSQSTTLGRKKAGRRPVETWNPQAH